MENASAKKEDAQQQACASCKHQRKKCKREICPLAPFFPAGRTQDFEAVQKVFGVSNVQKMIQALDTREKQSIVADSLIWEATCRVRDPLHGCSGEYKRLQDEYKRLQSEYKKLQLQVHSLQNPIQALKTQPSKNMQCFHNHVPQQNQSLLKTTYDNCNYIGYGGIATSNIDFGSLSHTPIQHNQDYSFTDQLYSIPMKANVELMNQFTEANIDASGHVDSNPINLDNIMSSLCRTSWQEP